LVSGSEVQGLLICYTLYYVLLIIHVAKEAIQSARPQRTVEGGLGTDLQRPKRGETAGAPVALEATDQILASFRAESEENDACRLRAVARCSGELEGAMAANSHRKSAPIVIA
jgi:hypothetical protein